MKTKRLFRKKKKVRKTRKQKGKKTFILPKKTKVFFGGALKKEDIDHLSKGLRNSVIQNLTEHQLKVQRSYLVLATEMAKFAVENANDKDFLYALRYFQAIYNERLLNIKSEHSNLTIKDITAYNLKNDHNHNLFSAFLDEKDHNVRKLLGLASKSLCTYTQNRHFPGWVISIDEWKHYKFNETRVFYSEKDMATPDQGVIDMVMKREPANVTMVRFYDQQLFKELFGYQFGGYSQSTELKLMPNIAIYTDAVIIKNGNVGEQLQNVHVINLVGYGFDSVEQPDYKYFSNKYGLKENSANIHPSALPELVRLYEQMWLKAYGAAKYLKDAGKGITSIYLFDVGGSAFKALAPIITNFVVDVFAASFSKVKELFDKENIKIRGLQDPNDLQKGFLPRAAFDIPESLFSDKELSTTLYVNAWDPWSLIGNGNEHDGSLDGFWGRNSNMSVLGWGVTNPFINAHHKQNYINVYTYLEEQPIVDLPAVNLEGAKPVYIFANKDNNTTIYAGRPYQIDAIQALKATNPIKLPFEYNKDGYFFTLYLFKYVPNLYRYTPVGQNYETLITDDLNILIAYLLQKYDIVFNSDKLDANGALIGKKEVKETTATNDSDKQLAITNTNNEIKLLFLTNSNMYTDKNKTHINKNIIQYLLNFMNFGTSEGIMYFQGLFEDKQTYELIRQHKSIQDNLKTKLSWYNAEERQNTKYSRTDVTVMLIYFLAYFQKPCRDDNCQDIPHIIQASKLLSTYDLIELRFPIWVLNAKYWSRKFQFDKTKVFYYDESQSPDYLSIVKNMAKQREPSNTDMMRNYNEKLFEQKFGWKHGAYQYYRAEANVEMMRSPFLQPNIAIYTYATVLTPDSPEFKKIHVINLTGYMFDSKEQPDYEFFAALREPAKILSELIKRYEKIWLMAYAAASKLKKDGLIDKVKLRNVPSNTNSLLPELVNRESSFDFFQEVFLPSFKRVKELLFHEGININVFDQQASDVLDADYERTLYVNFCDPWSLVGVNNGMMPSWLKENNMAILGWPETNPYLSMNSNCYKNVVDELDVYLYLFEGNIIKYATNDQRVIFLAKLNNPSKSDFNFGRAMLPIQDKNVVDKKYEGVVYEYVGNSGKKFYISQNLLLLQEAVKQKVGKTSDVDLKPDARKWQHTYTIDPGPDMREVAYDVAKKKLKDEMKVYVFFPSKNDPTIFKARNYQKDAFLAMLEKHESPFTYTTQDKVHTITLKDVPTSSNGLFQYDTIAYEYADGRKVNATEDNIITNDLPALHEYLLAKYRISFNDDDFKGIKLEDVQEEKEPNVQTTETKEQKSDVALFTRIEPPVFWIDEKNKDKGVTLTNSSGTIQLKVGDFITYKERPDGVKITNFLYRQGEKTKPNRIKILPWRKDVNRFATDSQRTIGITEHGNQGEISWDTVKKTTSPEVTNPLFEAEMFYTENHPKIIFEYWNADFLTIPGADTVVNGANNVLHLGDGLAGAIASADDDNQQVQQTCNKIMANRNGKKLETGSAINTLGPSNFPDIKKIIHTIPPQLPQIPAGKKIDELDKDLFKQAIQNTLREATQEKTFYKLDTNNNLIEEKFQTKVLVFPPIGTGLFHYPFEVGVKEIVDLTIKYIWLALIEHPEYQLGEIRKIIFCDTYIPPANIPKTKAEIDEENKYKNKVWLDTLNAERNKGNDKFRKLTSVKAAQPVPIRAETEAAPPPVPVRLTEAAPVRVTEAAPVRVTEAAPVPVRLTEAEPVRAEAAPVSVRSVRVAAPVRAEAVPVPPVLLSKNKQLYMFHQEFTDDKNTNISVNTNTVLINALNYVINNPTKLPYSDKPNGIYISNSLPEFPEIYRCQYNDFYGVISYNLDQLHKYLNQTSNLTFFEENPLKGYDKKPILPLHEREKLPTNPAIPRQPKIQIPFKPSVVTKKTESLKNNSPIKKHTVSVTPSITSLSRPLKASSSSSFHTLKKPKYYEVPTIKMGKPSTNNKKRTVRRQNSYNDDYNYNDDYSSSYYTSSQYNDKGLRQKKPKKWSQHKLLLFDLNKKRFLLIGRHTLAANMYDTLILGGDLTRDDTYPYIFKESRSYSELFLLKDDRRKTKYLITLNDEEHYLDVKDYLARARIRY